MCWSLISTRGGNVRIQNFLSDRRFQRIAIPAEFHNPSAPLPDHDLVVNAIGDADLAGPALTGAEAALVRQTIAPASIPPAAVLATGTRRNRTPRSARHPRRAAPRGSGHNPP